jgi:hypothetical protein
MLTYKHIIKSIKLQSHVNPSYTPRDNLISGEEYADRSLQRSHVKRVQEKEKKDKDITQKLNN